MTRSAPKRTRAQRLIAIGVGLAVGFSCFDQVVRRSVDTRWMLVLFAILLAIVGPVVAHWILSRVVFPRLDRYSRRACATWGMSCLLAGCLLTVAIPVRRPVRHALEIVATGERNPAALSSEVWVRLQRSDGSNVPENTLRPGIDWEIRDVALVSYKKQPTALRWNPILEEDAQVHLVSHPRSGIARITWDGSTQTIDLYGSSWTSKVITLPSNTSAARGLKAAIHTTIGFVASSIALAFFLLTAAVWLATREARAARDLRRGRWSWVWYAAPCAVMWTLYLLAYWPGFMTPDSFYQWGQMLTLQLNDSHPAAHTLTNWLFTRIALSPAAIAVPQIIALSVVFGITIRELENWEVPPAARWCSVALFAITPVNGILAMTLWKDIPYTIAFLGAFAVLLVIVRTRGNCLRSLPLSTALWLSLICVCFYRHNGWPTVLLILPFIYLVAQPSNRRRVLAIGLAVIGSFIMVKFPMYRLAGIQPMDDYFAGVIKMHQLAAVIQDSESLDEDTAQLLDHVEPLENWKKNYYCYNITHLVFNRDVDQSFVNSHTAEFNRIWWRLVTAHPLKVLQHQMCVNSLVWEVRQPKNGMLFAFVTKMDANPFGIVQEPKLPRVKKVLDTVVSWSTDPARLWFFWRPALYLYMGLFCTAVIALRRRDRQVLIIGSPIAANSLILMLINVSQDFRYQYPVYVIAFVLGALVFCTPGRAAWLACPKE